MVSCSDNLVVCFTNIMHCSYVTFLLLNLPIIQTFDITAIMDTLPELSESYLVTLLAPTLGRLAGQDTISQITIEPNQYPHGLFELVALSDPSSSTVTVEEGVGSVEFEVRRRFGTFGTVTVEWSTTGSSATDNSGRCMYSRCHVQYLHVVCTSCMLCV